MKSLRFYAFAFTLSVSLCGLNATDVFAQGQTLTPQIAKNQFEEKTNSPAVEETPKSESNQPSVSFSSRTMPKLTRPGVQTSQTLPLTLSEAIQKALENNNDIDVAKNDVRIAEQTLRSLLGYYDGVFTINPNIDRNSTTGREATTDFRVNGDFLRDDWRLLALFVNNSPRLLVNSIETWSNIDQMPIQFI